jgi:hypothetical protein
MTSWTISDLTFTLPDVLGHQRLDVLGLPSGWWLKSVLIDGEDVFDAHDFPVSGTVDGIVLLVTSRPSGVQGRVTGSGDALLGSSVLVLPGNSVEAPADISPLAALRASRRTQLHRRGSSARAVPAGGAVACGE